MTKLELSTLVFGCSAAYKDESVPKIAKFLSMPLGKIFRLESRAFLQ